MHNTHKHTHKQININKQQSMPILEGIINKWKHHDNAQFQLHSLLQTALDTTFDWHKQKQNYLKSDWMLCWVIMTSIFLKSDWMTSGHVTHDVLLSHHGKPDNFNFPEFFSGSRKIRAACRRVFWCNFSCSFRICSPFASSMHLNASYALSENWFFFRF